jgi:tetratricopeptide (TPR) repeat protein
MLKHKSISEFHQEGAESVHFLDLAEASLRAKRCEEAVVWLAKASKNAGFSKSSTIAYRFHYLRGTTLLWQGNAAAASGEAERALQIFRRAHPSLHLPERGNLPGFVVENLKQLRKIERTFLESLEEENTAMYGKKKHMLERQISEISSSLEHLNPLAKLHQLAGGALLELGKLVEAEEHLHRATTGFRLSCDWSSLAYTLNKISQLYHTRGDLPHAIQLLEQAIGYGIRAKDRYLEMILRANVGHCQLLCGMWRQAASALPQTLTEAKKAKDYPRYANALLFLGSLHLLRGRLKESRRALEEAQHLCSRKKLVGILKYSHGYWADLCMAEGRLEEAENHLKNVLDLSKEVTPQGGPVAEAWQKLGELFVIRKEYERALKTFALCMNQLSEHPEKLVEGAVYRGRGICHVKMEQFRPAQREFKKSFEIFESCGNEWELAKTAIIAAENGAFALAEIYPKLIWAKEIFKKLELPDWRTRAQTLLDHSEPAAANIPLRTAHQRTEKEQIAKALAETDGNISRAARKLGLLRQTLQYKIKQYQIEI